MNLSQETIAAIIDHNNLVEKKLDDEEKEMDTKVSECNCACMPPECDGAQFIKKTIKAEWVRETAKVLAITAISRDQDMATIHGGKVFVQMAIDMWESTEKLDG